MAVLSLLSISAFRLECLLMTLFGNFPFPEFQQVFEFACFASKYSCSLSNLN